MLRKEFGTWTVLNEKLDLDARDSTLSQYLNKAKGTKSAKEKVMGSAMARRLEQVCGKEVGWMDTDPVLTGEVTQEGGELQGIEDFHALRQKLRAEMLTELGLTSANPLTPEELQQLWAKNRQRFTPGATPPNDRKPKG